MMKIFTRKISYNNIAIFAFISGLFFINFSFFSDDNRRLFAFSFFLLATIFSLKNIAKNIINGFFKKSVALGAVFIIYVITYSYINPPIEAYGLNKYYYSLFIYILAFISIPYIVEKINIPFLTKGLLVFSLSYCFISIIFASAESRTGDSNLNPALLARICMIAGLYALINIKYDAFNLINWAILIIATLAVFFTGTKTPLPVAIVSFIIITNKKTSIFNLVKILILIIATTIISYFSIKYFLPEHLANRILDLDSFSSDTQGKEGNRLDLYKTALNAIASNIWGYGLGGFSIHHRFIVAPHNIILEYMVELGIVISAFFLMLVFKTLYLIKNHKTNDINFLFIESIFIYMFLSLLFGGELTIQAILLYLTMALIANSQQKTT